MKQYIPSYSKKLYPWIVWFLAACFFYYKYLIQVSPSVMNIELMSAYSLTGAGLGNLAACFFYGYLLMQIPVGIVLDKWSPGKVTSIAMFLCALGVYLFANTHTLITAGISRFLIGASASFAAVSCFKLASIWFPPRRFAFIAGLSMTAAMFGAVGGQGPLSWIIRLYGWRHALELIAAVGFIVSLLIWVIIRDKKAVPLANNESIEHENDVRNKCTIIVRDRQTWLLSLYSGLAFAPLSVFGGLWGVSFVETAYNLDIATSANFVSLIFIGFAVGCPLSGWISDHIGQRKPIMMLGTISSLTSLSLIIYLPLPKIFLIMNLFAFGVGASCFFLCFSMIRERHPAFITATVLGFMNTFDSICEAVTEPLIGRLLDIHWNGALLNGARVFNLQTYHTSFLTLCAYLVIAIVLLCFIEETGLSTIGIRSAAVHTSKLEE